MSSVDARDLKIADWMIEPEEKEKNLHAMVSTVWVNKSVLKGLTTPLTVFFKGFKLLPTSSENSRNVWL